MTKSDLIDVLCETQKLPKGRAELLVHVVFDSMEAALKRGERIEIRGFGSFEIRTYRSYEGRNPRTGVTVKVRPKRLPFFKVGKELKERVNDSRVGPGGPGGERAAAKRARGAAHAASDAAPVTATGVDSGTSAGSNAATEDKPAGASRATA